MSGPRSLVVLTQQNNALLDEPRAVPEQESQSPHDTLQGDRAFGLEQESLSPVPQSPEDADPPPAYVERSVYRQVCQPQPQSDPGQASAPGQTGNPGNANKPKPQSEPKYAESSIDIDIDLSRGGSACLGCVACGCGCCVGICAVLVAAVGSIFTCCGKCH